MTVELGLFLQETNMDSTILDAAVKELLKMPGYCESETLTLEKVTLRDGREALIRMEITTDEDELEDFEIWTPNA